jgi:hypothetical protein
MSRRRRKNPSVSDSLDVGVLLMFGVGAYLLYQFFNKAQAPGGVLDSVETSIANLFPGTSPSVTVQGTVILPGGATVPISNLTSNGLNSDGSLSMSDSNGDTYSVTSLGNGTYQAS